MVIQREALREWFLAEAGAVSVPLMTEGIWVARLSSRDLIRCGLEIIN